MLTQSQQERIARRCATAILRSVDAFPELLARSEPEAAAAIVADLIKAQLNRPAAELDPADQLAAVIQAATTIAESQD